MEGGFVGRRHPRSRVGRLLAVGAAAIVGGVLAVPAPAAAIDVRAGQWQLDALKIDQAHRIARGSGVTVAVVDSGVDATHRDLSGQILSGTAMGAARGGSNDGHGDTDGHGTEMAGDIAAKGGGRDHALGIAPGAKILPVKVTTGGTGDPADIAAGVRWATKHGATVINVSLSADGTAPSGLVAAMKYAMRHGSVVVAGAGNGSNGQFDVGYPANIPGVVAVSGTTRSGQFWNGSVSGPEVALAAPADGVVSTGSSAAGSRTGYMKDEGTSDAAAFVSGAAALVWSKYPDLTAPQVIERLIATADDAGPSGRDDQYGFGRLDVVNALTADDVPQVSKNPLLAGGGGDSASTPTGGKTLTIKNHTSSYLTVGALICAGVVVVVVVLALVLGRRGRTKRRRPSPPPAYVPPPGQPRGPPPGNHPQHGPPSAGPVPPSGAGRPPSAPYPPRYTPPRE